MIKILTRTSNTIRKDSPILFGMATTGAAKQCLSTKVVGDMKTQRKTGQTVTVQLTNNSSILSKYSMSKLGYFEDNFLKFFIDRRDARRSPLINRGYYVRAKAVDSVVKKFLSVAKEQDRSCQVVSLGAGFDTLFFRLHSQGLIKDVVVFEVDFPDVVRNKVNVIISNQPLSSSVGKIWTDNTPSSGIWADCYRLTGCDLKEIETLSMLLTQCQIDPNKPTLLLSECVMTYMEPKDSSAVIKWASDFFCEAVFITYEQIHPGDAFGQVMQQHFNNLNSPLRCINSYPDAQSQIGRYISLGWHSGACYDMNHFYYNLLSKEERQRVENLEIFDEYEEWHLKCSHYFILGAFSKQFHHAQGTVFPDAQEFSEPVTSPASTLPLHYVTQREVQGENGTFSRYGHTLTSLPSQNAVVVIGGFGEKEGCHRRLSNAVIFKWENEYLKEMCNIEICERMFHTATLLSDGRVFVYGGRRSPINPCATMSMLTISSWDTSSRIGIDVSVSEIRTTDEKDLDTSNVHSSPASEEEVKDQRKCPSSQAVSLTQSVQDGRLVNCTSVNSVEKMEIEKINNGDLNVKETTSETGMSHKVEPVSRWRHTATRIFLADGSESVFVFGGKNQLVSALGDCHIFCVEDRSWRTPAISEPLEPRHSHCATLWKSRYVVLSGGVDTSALPLSLLQVVDTQSQPMAVRTLQLTRPLPAIYSHTAHIISDKLFLVGGVSLQVPEFPPLVVVDLNNLTCSTVQLTTPPGVVIMLDKHCSSVKDSQGILLTGGGGNCFSFGTHLNKHPTYVDLQDFL